MSPSDVLQQLIEQGGRLHGEGRPEQALLCFEKALAMAPGDVQAAAYAGDEAIAATLLSTEAQIDTAFAFKNAIGEPASGAFDRELALLITDRDRLAAAITAPQNERFAQVMANRLWARLMGRGIVATVDDWERSTPTHPELLKWLGREFVAGGYNMKALARTILNSHAYQRAVDPMLKETPVLYTARANRRLAAAAHRSGRPALPPQAI